ncbi:amidohydrolase family protein [Actinophytocola sp.]|uniref:amidohydrolase family protein n=1 Tax=Actinophytocola sp. TaxID=1872138 RepID=UPI003D6AD385
MIVTDSQVHVWWRVTPGARPHQTTPLTPSRLLSAMNGAGVDRAMALLPTWSADDNEILLSAVSKVPHRLAFIARLSPFEPADREHVLTRWRHESFRGVRVALHTENRLRTLADGTLDWLWQLADRADIPVMMYAPQGMHAIEALLAQQPALRLILDHANLPTGARNQAAATWITRLCRMAQYPNLAVKLSALPRHFTTDYPASLLANSVRALRDAFGVRRIFWGSDLTRLPCDYSTSVRQMTEDLRPVWGDDIDWVMGRGISEWLDWPPRQTPHRRLRPRRSTPTRRMPPEQQIRPPAPATTDDST